MRGIAKCVPTAAIVLGVSLSNPGEALAKCSGAPGFSVIVDGVVVAEYRDTAGTDLAGGEPFSPESLDIAEMVVTCRWITPEDGGPRYRQDAIVILTRTGYAAALDTFFEEMAAAQEAHFAALGRYAIAVSELGPLGLSVEWPAKLDASEAGWSAFVELWSLDLGCQANATTAATPAAFGGAEPWTPRCFPMPRIPRPAPDPDLQIELRSPTIIGRSGG